MPKYPTNLTGRLPASPQLPAPSWENRFNHLSISASDGETITKRNSAMTVVSMTLQVSSDCVVQLYELGRPITNAYRLKADMIWSVPSLYVSNTSSIIVKVSSGTVNVEMVYVPGLHPELMLNHENRFYLASLGTGGGSTSLTINAQTGTAYAIADSDNGKVITQANASAANWTLAAPSASSFAIGWNARIKNLGSGFLTITITGANCDGATVIVVPPGGTFLLLSNGSNYEAINQNSWNGASVVIGGEGKWSYFTTIANAVITAVANQTRISSFFLETAALVSKAVMQVQTLSAGSFVGLGLFSNDGAVKILESGPIDGSTTGIKTVTLGTTYLLIPGMYVYAYTASDIVVQAVLFNTINAATVSNFIAAHPSIDGTAGNASVAGVLPTTLGTLNAATQNRLVGLFYN